MSPLAAERAATARAQVLRVERDAQRRAAARVRADLAGEVDPGRRAALLLALGWHQRNLARLATLLPG